MQQLLVHTGYILSSLSGYKHIRNKAMAIQRSPRVTGRGMIAAKRVDRRIDYYHEGHEEHEGVTP